LQRSKLGSEIRYWGASRDLKKLCQGSRAERSKGRANRTWKKKVSSLENPSQRDGASHQRESEGDQAIVKLGKAPYKFSAKPSDSGRPLLTDGPRNHFWKKRGDEEKQTGMEGGGKAGNS